MESAHFWNCVGRCSQLPSDEDCGRDAHSSDHGHSPGDIQSRRWDRTDLSMPMLEANGRRLVYRGEDTMLTTAAGEVVPLTSDGDDWYLKVLINNENVFIRTDVRAACHECPPGWVRCLSPESVNHARVNSNHQDTQSF